MPHEHLFGLHTYPGYHVTLDGRIYSERSGKFLSPIRMGEYRGVTIKNRDGQLVKRYVHRLVLEIFTGECPAGMHAAHVNGDRTDNRLRNLRWATPAENNRDKVRHGTVLDGERNPMARLTASQVREIRSRAQQGEVQRALAAEYGVSPMTISRAVNRSTWRNA